MYIHLFTDICFFFNDTATTEIYTLSLHDALPIWLYVDHAHPEYSTPECTNPRDVVLWDKAGEVIVRDACRFAAARSEEHTSELQSRQYLVCRLLLEKKKTNTLI